MPTAVQIAFSSIDPFVRFVGQVHLAEDAPTAFRMTYDHRFFFVLRGTVQISCSDSDYTLSPDDVFYLPSGTAYRIFPVNGDALLIVVNFDFYRRSDSPEQSFHFQTPREFQPERVLETVAFSDTKLFRAPLFVRKMPELRPYLEQMVSENTTGEWYYRAQISHLYAIVLTLFYRRAVAPQSSHQSAENYRQILLYIQEHAAEPLSNQLLGKLFNYHPNYINQLVRAQTGYSLHRYVLQVRIRRATQLLMTTDWPVSQIAQTVGFQDISYFSQYYRKCTGVAPSDTREFQHQPR